ncbi:MAG: endo alpha-1,4 polygalactosaminidase [Anaerolineae bacterium]|nr:endo alpha-1,4 polygalactosaminidase [Anaerolineae bacterium]
MRIVGLLVLCLGLSYCQVGPLISPTLAGPVMISPEVSGDVPTYTVFLPLTQRGTTSPLPSPTISPTAAPTASPTLPPPVTPTATPTPTPPSDSWADVQHWIYQLTDYENDHLNQIAASGFDLAVVDLARDGSSDYFTASEITAVKNTGKVVLAYFEIGAIENYRPEWDTLPPDLLLGSVAGWPGERYVKYWDERWWAIVQGRLDQALAAGFDGAYLDMIVTYEEIPANAAGTTRADLAARMVDLIARASSYAKTRNPAFKIVPQNAPELRAWAKYLPAIDGLGIEELYYLAADEPCAYSWCAENRAEAVAIAAAGKLVLTVDYANQVTHIADAYTRSLAAGFVPYVTVQALDVLRVNPGWPPY